MRYYETECKGVLVEKAEKFVNQILDGKSIVEMEE